MLLHLWLQPGFYPTHGGSRCGMGEAQHTTLYTTKKHTVTVDLCRVKLSVWSCGDGMVTIHVPVVAISTALIEVTMHPLNTNMNTHTPIPTHTHTNQILFTHTWRSQAAYALTRHCELVQPHLLDPVQPHLLEPRLRARRRTDHASQFFGCGHPKSHLDPLTGR